MPKHTPYQQKIIKRYYEHREAISLQRLQELVTELFLAEGKRRDRQWELILGHLTKLGVKPERMEQLRRADDPARVAKLVEELMANS